HSHLTSGVKSRILTHACSEHPEGQSLHTVSVLDLEQYRSWSEDQLIPTWISQTILMFLSLNDVNSSLAG
ncbi:MAG: hypothetical protein ACLGIP_20200, partial [Alphaproteobacteria bacterium]